MPEGTGLADFAERFPDRFFDVGIAEQHGVTFAAGMAVEGYKPVVAIYSTFLQRAYDQIIHDVCIENLPVTFAIDRGGIVGEDGPTHHGQFDLSYMRNLPNMVVMAPKDENELRRMMFTAIEHSGPVAIRYPRGVALGVTVEPTPEPLPIGQAEVLGHGDDLLIIAIGNMVHFAQEAQQRLKADGINVTVINGRFVKPLDEKTITELAQEIPRILTVEENAIQGGFGSAVLEMLSDQLEMPLQIKRMGIPDRFIEHGSAGTLRSKYGLTTDGIIENVKAMLPQAKAPKSISAI
jgi:1-deoxy-D-xylulose-5-phosphate synthase